MNRNDRPGAGDVFGQVETMGRGWFDGWSCGMMALIVVTLVRAAPATEPTSALDDYVRAKDSSYRWTLQETRSTDRGRVHRIQLVSQTWQGIRWQHRMLVLEPRRLAHADRVLLFITGGSTGREPSKADQRRYGLLAGACGARVAVLYQVPNQPLLGNKFEDDLISETFLRHLKTKDPNWPLLFPMVKSAVRAMDAVQELAREKWKTTVNGFVVTGASKRGWTTWLTAAVDKRVKAIAPLVIDTLNLAVQTKHQKRQWGRFSKQIGDYTSKGLIALLEKKPDLPLWRWIDPYSYRDRLTLPKLIVNGTNDPYWCVDALNNYWPGLVGPKYALYIPNAGHGLEGGEAKLRSALGAFFRLEALGRELPRMTWKHGDQPGALRLQATSDPAPVEAAVWSARSSTRDFRKSKFTSTKMRRRGREFVGDVSLPQDGHVVLYGHFTFLVGDLRYGLSTQVRVR
ncbi:MAG: phenylacetic acid degradation protein [Planctomycetaceae bacterium]|jgi:PhoPQ-activated pathogenicity-related protein|nr:phenylacetic acid degradation protein [Planctomycetaceae bacterium]MDP7277116.1 PhoPQ-activated protein PqaA family protein [Planctomycetaceae bacterium]